jgi:hypothetical protein
MKPGPTKRPWSCKSLCGRYLVAGNVGFYLFRYKQLRSKSCVLTPGRLSVHCAACRRSLSGCPYETPAVSQVSVLHLGALPPCTLATRGGKEHHPAPRQDPASAAEKAPTCCSYGLSLLPQHIPNRIYLSVLPCEYQFLGPFDYWRIRILQDGDVGSNLAGRL